MINRASTKFIFPLEALSALAIIGVVALATGWGVKTMQRYENDGKAKRWDVDKWDRMMMERDSRMTGNVNKQQAEVEAPPQFSRNSAWELEPSM
ncbi:hypothetical protein BASA50_005497 [Batrachochytrium salamandrivorans]|uniref:NADH dehydrogenase [ubiquinone] 1 alpha subcomplex subunit 1 n=1 Tax=Batrachochytrium salamandrivorans TaxID=1357716 RepID=A0ABQ8FDU7_9FUNG|nr:hypothetical protein BASA60_005048 [Batrachochytrium salamandrivorans]KAH6577733.1 hypothetical protein BASA62_000714 [Batrachochytrium salamandrivorans]KAH6584870.1 hypothetical protein BASA61_007238 [Batrachochytrium salamandrivorans]KAH6595917.1 hypothetical protein BASA50_005497 [Batrachochytrium salamandrivorans]KAH9249280.1 hypothetical protein BASA81_013007 [Batrachochytrium salamandrivorans]